MMNYTKGRGKKRGWLLEEDAFDESFLGKCEAIFTQGNGYLGLRNSMEEQYVGTTRNMFVAGTFNKAGSGEVTELPNIPDITGTELEIDGQRFSLHSGTLKEYSRILNLYTGETVRDVRWVSGTGTELLFSFHRFVSFDNVHIIGNYIEMTAVNKSAEIRISSGIDAQVTNHGAQHFHELSKRVLEDNCLEFPVITTESGVVVAVHTSHRITAGSGQAPKIDIKLADERRRLLSCYTFTIERGQTVRFEKISTVCSGRDLEYERMNEKEAGERALKDGRRLIYAAHRQGYDRLFEKSCRKWKNLWESQDILIESKNETDQLTIRFALYHLQIMVRRGDSRIGIGAKGLSGEVYKGHSFWDTETFIFPYFQFAQPEVARTLLEYRFRGLHGARKKAKENGFAGAMYPWESAWIHDGEVTPEVLGVDVRTGKMVYCLTGKLEIHITCDIAYALWQYYLASGDKAFMERCGYEMIIETARFWNTRLEWIPEKERYEIRDVVGPDEYKDHVNNNAYTNYMAKYNLDLAICLLDRLAGEASEVCERLSGLTDLAQLKKELVEKAEKLYLPAVDPKTGIIPQFDGYEKLQEIDLSKYKNASAVATVFRDYSREEIQHFQAGKQADVVELLYQLEDLAEPEVKRRNYLYYEARTLHDSSLSRAIHSVMACDLGMEKEAYEMFVKAALTDMGPEMRSSDAGIHSANMGGIWQDVVMGFGGLRISRERLRIHPHLPKEWTFLKYSIYWRGCRLEISVWADKIRILNDGLPIQAVVGSNEVTICNGENQFPYDRCCKEI